MKKVIILLIVVTALLLAGYAGLRGYRVWKQNHMLVLAREFIARSDQRNAVLCLRQVIASRPDDPEAYRLLADLAEEARSPEAVLLRNRVVELAPASEEDGLALAESAIRFNDLITASNALQRVAPAATNSAKFHNLAGDLAVLSRQYKRAETHWLNALRLEPTNKIPHFGIASLRLRHTNEQTQAQGRLALRELTSDPELSCRALRELMVDAARNRRTNEVEALIGQLVQQTNAAFGDKLLQLELFGQKQDPSYASQLAALRLEAAADAAKASEMANWQINKLGPAETLTWLAALPAEIQTNQVVALVAADCRSVQKDWTGLQSALEPQNWGALEFMRYAMMARALNGQGLAAAAKTTWEQAVKRAQGDKQRLTSLLQVAAQWDLAIEQEQLLWMFVAQFPGETWAPQVLARLLYGRGQTHGLLTLYSQLARANPANIDTKNNLAMMALLLDAQQFRPHALAQEAYSAAPTNVHFASTYAFSLYLQDKKPEALKVLERLAATELDDPQRAGYYAVLLQENGEKAKAAKYFEAAARAVLLPEERKLIERAKHL